ncbi:hypothetical protein A9Q84_14635 [Halobacteriovorax marinus]|uniref:SF4 helicase domain-containing protein n=1 Tax=Halobacteriovorax marinus TaxID=97084 RepID=A0A1Y5F8Y6_9BACT|nr:hypothetical protein A9Q84_14635 [Halobacteriovorax marinus]
MDKINKSLKSVLKRMEDYKDVDVFETGFPDLDDRLGIDPESGQLIVIASRPGIGKSALALNIATARAVTSKKSVAYFSLEMQSKELSQRLIIQHSKVDSSYFRNCAFTDSSLRKIGKTIAEISQLPIFISDEINLTMSKIRENCLQLQHEGELGIIVIDYIQLIANTVSGPGELDESICIMKELKTLAREMKCPILVLSQVCRGVDDRINKRPYCSDLRPYPTIESDADVIIFIYRDDYYDPDSRSPGIGEIIIAKNRTGETGTVLVNWNSSYVSFLPCR